MESNLFEIVKGKENMSGSDPLSAKIEHIVVIMLENRGFDNILGYLYTPQDLPAHHLPELKPDEPPFHGLAFANTQDLANPLQQNGKTILRQPPLPSVRATNSPGFDPGEEYEHVNTQLFGTASPPEYGTPPTMKGFLQDYSNLVGDGVDINTKTQIMHMFTPADLPVISSLARGYAVSDMWFSSVPTQTNANRAFSLCGTSVGLVDNGFLSEKPCDKVFQDDSFPTDTIWNVLAQHGRNDGDDWAIFWHDAYPPAACTGFTGRSYTWNSFPHLQQIPGAENHFHQMDTFFEMAAAGRLPAYSYIEPSWGGAVLKDWLSVMGNEYHPPSDVTPGEHLLKQIYLSLIKNKATWEKTLLVITFDEHGGTFDHVPPPWGATPPWGAGEPDFKRQHDFNFNRFGVRIPTILVSPQIEQGTVFRSPGTPFDHTSVIATVLKWMLPHVSRKEWGLGERVLLAPTFDHILNREQPRTDNIFTLQPPPPPGKPLCFGDPFFLRHISGEYLTSAHSGILYYFPTIGDKGDRVKLDFRLGWGEVKSGATVQIRTAEYLQPTLGLEPKFKGWYAAIRNFLGAWKYEHDCYYFSTNDAVNFGEQYWTVSRADSSSGSIRYGDQVTITSNFFPGQRLTKDTRWFIGSGYITTAADAKDIWIIEPAGSG